MADRNVDRTDEDRTIELESTLREMFAAGKLEVLTVDGEEYYVSRRAATPEAT